MQVKFKFALIFLLVTTITLGTFVSIMIVKHGKETYRLKSKIAALEDNLETSQEEIEELSESKKKLEEQLSAVKHFDSGNESFGGSSSGVSYTGSAIETTIDGEFEGWDGDTVFKMMDGSIWQQQSYDYTYHYDYMPDVLIYRKAGSYFMRVEGVDDEIQVTRIR